MKRTSKTNRHPQAGKHRADDRPAKRGTVKGERLSDWEPVIERMTRALNALRSLPQERIAKLRDEMVAAVGADPEPGSGWKIHVKLPRAWLNVAAQIAGVIGVSFNQFLRALVVPLIEADLRRSRSICRQG